MRLFVAIVTGGVLGILSGAIGYSQESLHVYFIHNDLESPIPAYPIQLSSEIAPASLPATGKITVQTTHTFQKIAGIGAAFSEIGTLAFATLPEPARADLLTHLFDSQQGAGFSFCRLPVGSSDFAKSAYSYSEVPEDYEMKSFTLERDEKSIIPVVLAALRINPALQLFASPWSPPGWMKVSGTMDKGGPLSHLKEDEKIYKAYALYLSKYLQGYAKDGIPIARLCPQNEMDCNPGYPGCVIEPPQMINLVSHYLAPQLKADHLSTELWPGTFRESLKAQWAAQCLKDEGFRNALTGLGIQYFNGHLVDKLVSDYPGLRLMHTEASCENGKNTPDQANKRFGEMIGIFKSGCETYSYWNMLLDENQKSGWGWAQNSLVTLNTTTHEVRFNPDYSPVCLVSHFVRPGSVRVDCQYTETATHQFATQACAFMQGDQVVILIQNKTSEAQPIDLDIDGSPHRALIPAHSDCVVLCPSGALPKSS